MQSSARIRLRPDGANCGQRIPTSSAPLVLALPAPHGVALLVSEHQRVVPPHDFSRQDKICSLLLDLRPGESDLISFAEAHAYFIQEGTRAEIHVNDFRPDLPEQMRNLLLASLRRQFHFLDCSLQLRLCAQVVLWAARVVSPGFLSDRWEPTKECVK